MTIWNERLEENLQGITFYEDGKKDGKIIGEKNKEREMIINMNNKKIDINTIAECANLSLSEVQNIIDSTKE